MHRQRLAKQAPCARQQTTPQSQEQQDFAPRWYTDDRHRRVSVTPAQLRLTQRMAFGRTMWAAMSGHHRAITQLGNSPYSTPG